MSHVKPPVATEFFAAPSGVCVHVHVGTRQICVEFQSMHGPVIARGSSAADVAEATAAATAALELHRDQLTPLFARVADDQRARRRREG